MQCLVGYCYTLRKRNKLRLRDCEGELGGRNSTRLGPASHHFSTERLFAEKSACGKHGGLKGAFNMPPNPGMHFQQKKQIHRQAWLTKNDSKMQQNPGQPFQTEAKERLRQNPRPLQAYRSQKTNQDCELRLVSSRIFQDCALLGPIPNNLNSMCFPNVE